MISKRALLLSSFLIFIVAVLSTTQGICQGNERVEINIPDILGYITLKCDFHMHTVFSDGEVWPTVRVDEAWRQGLDAIAITDHVEYQPHKNDVPTSHNRPFELAQSRAEALRIILIRGTEITRSMPPGHLNAIFLNDVNPIDTEDFLDAVKAAIAQGAFVFWNHPGWTGQQPDGVARWYPIHSELLEKGWLHGIEVVNQYDYYPQVHDWCLEKRLTMVGNSDVHEPITMTHDPAAGEHRPVTLVFAEERNPDAIKKALFAQRTAVYKDDMIIGEERYVTQLFYESIEINNPGVLLKPKGKAAIQIHNSSDLPFEVVADKAGEPVAGPASIVLRPHKTVLFVLSRTADGVGERDVALSYRVKNLLIAPDHGAPVEIKVKVMFTAAE